MRVLFSSGRMKLWAALTLTICLINIWTAPANAQNVADALLSMYRTGDNANSLGRAAGNLLTALQPPTATTETLPQCEKTNVLLNSGKFPRDWHNLTADQQVLHPINLVMMQLAYAVYQPPETFKTCLGAMGVHTNSTKAIQKLEPEYQATRTAFVLKAGTERIFVMVKGSDVTDVTINMACRHEKLDGGLFGAPGRDIRLHRGYWRGWQVLENDVVATVKSYLKQAPSAEVHVVGHSLGAATAAIAALRLNTVLKTAQAKTPVAGVWLLAAPRSGNAEWSRVYNQALQSRTLRFSNYQDFAVRMPGLVQRCSLGGRSIYAETASFAFSHVGRSVLMCPDEQSGLTMWKIFKESSENVDCDSASEVDASATTHQLGSYFDAWRRGYFNSKGSNLAEDPRVMAVLCQECTFKANTKLEQIAVPARPGGPVGCGVDASCSVQRSFDAATAVAQQLSTRFDRQSVCSGFMCADV